MTANKTPDISVIIPVYNVEEYLRDCLDSLMRQGNVSLEVIMVDDGSPDTSGQIAQEYDDNYENFHCLHIPNGGLGHARNYAVPYATGKYIIFLDSDDVIVDGTYEKMFRMAERNHSDMTICNVARFNSTKTWASSLHKTAFTDAPECTHISRNHNLLYDTTSWNKLIRREFYLQHHFAFPENILYEDIPVTIPMHILANNVSVVNSVGYLWRTRDGVSKSITQNAASDRNMQDRLTIMRMLDRFFRENVTDESLKEDQQLKALRIDLMIFVNNCKGMEREQALEVFGILQEYIKEAIDPKTFRKLALINQQKYRYVMENDIDSLWKLFDYQNKKYYEAPVHEVNGRLIADLPSDLFTIEDRDITGELADSDYRKYIDNITINDSVITLTGHIYKRRINIRTFEEQKAEAWLYNEASGSRLPLPIEACPAVSLTETYGTTLDADDGTRTEYNYDGTGFKITLDMDALEIPEDAYGYNKIQIAYENRYHSGLEFLGGVDNGKKREFDDVAVYHGDEVTKLRFDVVNDIVLFIEGHGIFCEQKKRKGDKLELTLSRDPDYIKAVAEDGKASIPVRKLHARTFEVCMDEMEPETRYFLIHDNEYNVMGRERSFILEDTSSGVLAYSTVKTGNFSLMKKEWISSMILERKNNTSLEMLVETMGHVPYTEAVAGCRLSINDPLSGHPYILGEGILKKESGKLGASFKVDFGDEEITRNFYAGFRDLYAEYILDNGEIIRSEIYKTDYFKERYVFETLKITCYRSASGTVRLHLEQRWPKKENNPQKRKRLTYQNYPKFREEKLNPRQIVFESMWGTKYSCNPQALYEYIDENHPEYECIWSLNDPRTPIKGRGIRVRRGSQEYYHYMATATYFVNNVNFASDYVKREGQIEIQTMHGTPLKTLGLDVEDDFPTLKSREDYIAKNKRWNYLIVQGDFMAEKGKPIFEFEKDVLRTGYPRTDRLYHMDESRTDAIKDMLGIPKDKKIILYVPTWRIKNHFDMMLDIEKMRAKLSDEYVLLIRLHHLCASGYTIPADNKFVFNLNSYEYVEDLYMISDIMITDYSSVMFDFALLKKPMIFFTYDMEEYCDTLRGLYVDFRAEAPGPIVYNTEELVQAVLHMEEESEKCRDRVEAFIGKYLTYENPDSSKMVFDEVIKPVPKDPVYDLKKKMKKMQKNMKSAAYRMYNSNMARSAARLKNKIIKK